MKNIEIKIFIEISEILNYDLQTTNYGSKRKQIKLYSFKKLKRKENRKIRTKNYGLKLLSSLPIKKKFQT